MWACDNLQVLISCLHFKQHSNSSGNSADKDVLSCICRGSAIASSLSQIVICLLLFGYIRWKKLHEQTWGGLLYTRSVNNTYRLYKFHVCKLVSSTVYSEPNPNLTITCENLQAGPLTACKSGAPTWSWLFPVLSWSALSGGSGRSVVSLLVSVFLLGLNTHIYFFSCCAASTLCLVIAQACLSKSLRHGVYMSHLWTLSYQVYLERWILLPSMFCWK